MVFPMSLWMACLTNRNGCLCAINDLICASVNTILAALFMFVYQNRINLCIWSREISELIKNEIGKL